MSSTTGRRIIGAIGAIAAAHTLWSLGYNTGKEHGIFIGERRGEDRMFGRFMEAVDAGVWVPGTR